MSAVGVGAISGTASEISLGRADDQPCRMLHQGLGVAVAAVITRLAPEHRHPESLNESIQAFDGPARPTLGRSLIKDRRTARAAQ